MRLLVATSDACMGRLLVAVLQRWGYRPVVVTGAAEAVAELTRPGGPRLALLDTDLASSALEVCRQVRARERLERSHLIVLGLEPCGPGVAEALAAGASDYLNDSSNLGELAARVEAGRRQLDWQQELLESRGTGRLCPACYDGLMEEVRRLETAPPGKVPERPLPTRCPSWN
jgi:sigma-B regulation protein RsbU (phosphoserine phosphatase)